MHKYILSRFNINMIPTISYLRTRIVPQSLSARPSPPGFYQLLVYTVFFLCLFFITSCQSSSQPKLKSTADSTIMHVKAPVPLSDADKIRYHNACEIWYDSVLKNSNFNGGILVAKNGNIVFEKYQGTAHLKSTDSITATTALHIASISKTFTAMCILKLWQDKKLSLDDEYSKYFPSFNYPGITIRTLLDHRSGLPNYLYFMEDLDWDKKVPIKNQDVLETLINKKGLLKNIATPDKRFNYCNTNYALLALLAEKVSGTAFPALIKKTFFDPLQMKHSYIFTHADSATATPSYDWRGRLIPLDFLDDVYGDKNVYTTPQDLLIWDRALSSNLIFAKETLEEAYKPYSNEKQGIRNYGLGWRMNIYPNGKKIIYHNGWWHGSNASFIRLLQEDVTIILIGNKFCRNIYKAKDLSNIFSNYYEKDAEEDAEPAKIIADKTDSLLPPSSLKK